MKLQPKQIPSQLAKLSIAVAIASHFTAAQAMEIDFGSRDIDARWSNTLKYSGAFRVKDLDEDVSATNYNPNLDAGDHNFDTGLISNRVDVLSEFDFRYKRKMGFRVSAAGWYDDVYHGSTDSDLAIPNTTGVSNSEFNDETKDLHGGDLELLDAFVYGRTKIGGRNLNVKLGQFTQIYGESLFFGANGVANAQATPDIVKLLSVPGSQIKEILRPVEQIALDYSISPDMSVGAYYQLEWEPAQIPGVGSYFSFADHVGAGGNLLLLPGPLALNRAADITPSDSGQFGVQLRFNSGDTEYGLYASRHHDRFAQFYFRPALGDYALVFAEDIETYGASMSTLIGETNVAAEISHRRNTPLNAAGNVVIDNTGLGDGNDNALYPVGNTWHVNLSAISVFPGNELWDGAALVGEFAYNYLDSIDKNADQLDPNATRDASAIRVQFIPEYFQVTSGVDLKVPISVGYGIHGRSSVIGPGGMPPEHGGDISIGVTADIAKKWQAGVSYTHYFGDASGVLDENANLSYKQFHKDRDFISFNIQRTF